MRLLSITVRNYRVHEELGIRFDPSLNLIGGPNESGKSTLAEAAHRVLFVRAKTGGSIRKEMISTRHLGEPEVLLSFETGGISWDLEKRFAGTKGSARLSGGGAIYKDDEAEVKLTEILKVETTGGRVTASQLSSLWSHLWVWQGSACDDPAGHATTHKDTLMQRLQPQDIAAVMQSAKDQRVREKIAASYEEIYTPATGKLRSGSKPEQARSRVAEAEAGLQRAREIAARLEEAAGQHARAEEEIREIDTALPRLREQLAVTTAKLQQVAELRRQEETRRFAWDTAVAGLKRITEGDSQIRGLQEQTLAANDALKPATAREAKLAEEEQSAREASSGADQAQRSAADALRQARLHYDLAAASVTAFEKGEARDALAKRAAEAEKVRADLATCRSALSKLPALHAKDLQNLRALEREAAQASATLEAMAAGIELIRSELPVSLNGRPLAEGQSSILTDDADLVIDEGTVLRIRPGGGTSLTDARAREDAAGRALSTAFDRLTLRNLDHAATIFEERQVLEQEIARLDTRWNALGGESLVTSLRDAEATLEEARELVRRRRDAMPNDGPTGAASPEEARALQAKLQGVLAEAERAEGIASRSAEQLRAAAEKASRALQLHREQLSGARQAARDLETRIKVLEGTHGGTAERETALRSASEAEQGAGRQLTAARESLAALSPATLDADLDRLQRAIHQHETRRNEAEGRRLIARDRLTLDGSSDPQAELAQALARYESARETHASELRRAMAVEKLHKLFNESREAIDRSLVQPLAERISGYLQCIFGPAATVKVSVSEDGIEGIELVRSDDPAFGFNTLSGGTREQVAAAVRLAMAEILAADHGGCLPLVFDDAFANSDAERLQSLQRMLDRAARQGLQVIVLSCNPGDFSGLGAAEVRLA